MIVTSSLVSPAPMTEFVVTRYENNQLVWHAQSFNGHRHTDTDIARLLLRTAHALMAAKNPREDASASTLMPQGAL